MGTVSQTSALLLDDSPMTRIRLVPFLDAVGNASFTFRAWDRSNPKHEGVAGDKVSTSKKGGEYPFSSDEGTAVIEVRLCK